MLKVTLGVAIAALALAAAATATAVIGHSQINSLRAQLAQADASQAKAARLISAQEAKLAGNHRDLLTCGDLSTLINDGYIASYYVDSSSNLQSTAASLPSHCVNN